MPEDAHRAHRARPDARLQVRPAAHHTVCRLTFCVCREMVDTQRAAQEYNMIGAGRCSSGMLQGTPCRGSMFLVLAS